MESGFLVETQTAVYAAEGGGGIVIAVAFRLLVCLWSRKFRRWPGVWGEWKGAEDPSCRCPFVAAAGLV